MNKPMFPKSILAHGLLALALSGAANWAQAGGSSSYHAEIDTASFAGNGWLDFQFFPGNSPATGATATLSHFSGAFGSEYTLDSGSGSVAGSVSLYNSGMADLFHAVDLGGKFSFDVSFDGDFTSQSGNVGTTFSVGLLDASQAAYLGNPDGALFKIDLMPMNGAQPASITLSDLGGGISSVTPIAAAVPEPGSYALLLAGLGLLVARGKLSARRQGD